MRENPRGFLKQKESGARQKFPVFRIGALMESKDSATSILTDGTIPFPILAALNDRNPRGALFDDIVFTRR